MSERAEEREDGESETVPLSMAARFLLEECRMVLPGIQALFGFQLIVVFSTEFAAQLSNGEQGLHLAAITLTAVAVGLIMTPATLHRHERKITALFIRVSSRLLLASMFPLRQHLPGFLPDWPRGDRTGGLLAGERGPVRDVRRFCGSGFPGPSALQRLIGGSER